MTGSFLVEPLGPSHDRTEFTCGVDPLDRYFREQAGQDVRRRATACFVAREIATDRIAAFYTLAAAGVLLAQMPVRLAKRLPRYPAVPVARLRRLAVALAYHGHKLGGALLWDAIERAGRSEVAVYALVVDAKDAKSFGAIVTGVCSTRNVDMVRSIGADQVIDYTQQDFTKSGQRYDIVLDCVGNHSFSEWTRVLNPKGILVGVGAPPDVPLSRLLVGLIGALVRSVFVSQKIAIFIARVNQQDLTTVGELMAAGTVTPVIDKRYRLSEARDAFRYMETGHARGKVIITPE